MNKKNRTVGPSKCLNLSHKFCWVNQQYIIKFQGRTQTDYIIVSFVVVPLNIMIQDSGPLWQDNFIYTIPLSLTYYYLSRAPNVRAKHDLFTSTFFSFVDVSFFHTDE